MRLSGSTINLSVPSDDTLSTVHQELQALTSATEDTLTDIHSDLTGRAQALKDTLTATHADVTGRAQALKDTLTATHADVTGRAKALADTLTDVHEKVQAILMDLYAGTKTATTTEDLAQSATSYTLFTGTTADVILEGISLRNANVNCSDDASFTGISIQTDDATVATFISQTDGVKANLTAEATIAWTGSAVIKTGTIIKLTIYGAAADATCAADIIATYRPTGTGTGTLVP